MVISWAGLLWRRILLFCQVVLLSFDSNVITATTMYILTFKYMALFISTVNCVFYRPVVIFQWRILSQKNYCFSFKNSWSEMATPGLWDPVAEFVCVCGGGTRMHHMVQYSLGVLLLFGKTGKLSDIKLIWSHFHSSWNKCLWGLNEPNGIFIPFSYSLIVLMTLTGKACLEEW